MFDQVQVNVRGHLLNGQPGIFSRIICLFELPSFCQCDTGVWSSTSHNVCALVRRQDFPEVSIRTKWKR
jgi:hypothetical protein